MGNASWFRGMPDAEGRAAIKARIAREGALSTMAFDSQIEGPKEMWRRPPHKLALDFMWYTGELATCYRENFRKFYNLSERVIPDRHRETEIEDATALDWLCTQALDRLGFATPGDIQRFWDATTSAEVRGWVAKADLQPVEIQTANRETLSLLAPPDLSERLTEAPPPTSRLRILSPFDPVVRDRDRLKNSLALTTASRSLFRRPKRKWGYMSIRFLRATGSLDGSKPRRTAPVARSTC